MHHTQLHRMSGMRIRKGKADAISYRKKVLANSNVLEKDVFTFLQELLVHRFSQLRRIPSAANYSILCHKAVGTVEDIRVSSPT